MKQIYTIEFKNHTTGDFVREIVAADRASRAQSNFIRRMRYHGLISKGDRYSVEMWWGGRNHEQLTMEV